MEGWIKLHRNMLNWRWATSSNHLAVFVTLLLRANHKCTVWRKIEVQPGQLVTGRKQLSSWTGLSEMQIRVVLKDLITSGEINQQLTSKFSIISINNWIKYQDDNQQITSKQPASNQQITTSKNAKNVKNEKNERSNIINCEAFTGEQNLDEVPVTELAKNILTALNTLCFKSFRPSAANMKFINARIKENYNLEDFVAVIKSKQASWGNNPEMSGYLRPSTLFGTKFDGYLQETKTAFKTNSRHQSNDITEDDLIEAKKLGIL